jgi:hypothetical protein
MAIMTGISASDARDGVGIDDIGTKEKSGDSLRLICKGQKTGA